MKVKFPDGVTVNVEDVIVLARLSKKVEGSGQGGIESQDIDAREMAQDDGFNVVDTVADHASGTKAMWDRPKAKPWVTQADLMAKYQGIIAAKHDRLTRADWSEEADLRKWAEKHHKALFLVEKNLRWPPRDDENHDDDVSRWNRAQEDSHEEWNRISRRYKRMQRLRTANNQLTGKAPYGYRIQGIECGESPCRCYERKIDDHKTLVIYEPEAMIVREAARRYIDTGESIEKICADFNARGTPSPMWRGQPGKHWHMKTLAELLRSPSIAGRRTDANGKTILRYDGIITWQDHEAIVKRMDSRANRKGISPANVFMLTGIIVDETGHPMYGASHRKRWHYYRCRHCGFAIRMDEVEHEVSASIIEDYGHLPHKVQRIIPGKNYFEDIAKLRQDRAELDDLAADYETGHAEITAEIRRLSKLPAEPDEVKWVPSGKTIAEHWQSLDNAARRDWLRENGWKVTVIKDDEMPCGWCLQIDAGELTKEARALGAEGPEDIARNAYALADAMRSALEAKTP